MTTATTRRDSTLRQMQKRVPADIVKLAQGRSYPITLPSFGPTPETMVEVTILPVIKLSLRVRDPAAAKARIGAINAQLERIFASIRGGTVELSHKQAVSLSGEIYRLVVEGFEMNPGELGDWDTWKGFHWAAMEGRLPNPPSVSWREIMMDRNTALGNNFPANTPVLIDVFEGIPSGDSERSLEVHFGLLASWVLARHALEVTPSSRLKLLRQVAEASLDAGWAMKRASEGDYTPDPKAARFPAVQSITTSTSISLEDLFERWKIETKPSASTVTTWRGIVSSLQKHLTHGNASATKDYDIVAWKDSRVALGRSTKTINDSDLACLRAIFRFGVTNKLLANNPAEGIKVRIKRRAGEGRLPYTDDEVAKLLFYAEQEELPHLRWIPLLLATTGARVQDIVQLWSEGVTVEDGVPVLRIAPAADGGRLKNKASERVVPMHPALIESGFIKFARSKTGPLFYGGKARKKRTDEDGKHASVGTSNRVSKWVRSLPGFDNPRKAPSHSFRHWLKSAAAKAGVLDSVADHIQGHSNSTVAGRYRHHDDLKSIAAELAKIRVPLLTSS